VIQCVRAFVNSEIRSLTKSPENSLMQHSGVYVLWILPLFLTRSSLGLGQDDRDRGHGGKQGDLAGAEVSTKTAKSQRKRFASRPDWLCGVAESIALGKEAVERGVATYLLSCTAQLAIVVLDVPAALVVAQGGIFHLAIFLLAAGLERIAVYLNVLAGLGE